MVGGFRQWDDVDDPRREIGPVPQELDVLGLIRPNPQEQYRGYLNKERLAKYKAAVRQRRREEQAGQDFLLPLEVEDIDDPYIRRQEIISVGTDNDPAAKYQAGQSDPAPVVQRPRSLLDRIKVALTGKDPEGRNLGQVVGRVKRIGDDKARILAPGTARNLIPTRQRERIAQEQQQREAFLALSANEASEVLSKNANRPIPPEFSGRVQGYLRALPEMSVTGAAYLAQNEGNLTPEALGRLAVSGELGPDPAARGVISSLLSGASTSDESTSAQASAISPYIEAAKSKQQKYTDIPSINKRSAEILDPYLVPVLMAEATEEYKGKRQPETFWNAPYPEGRKAINPRNVRLELLDPSALVSWDTADALGLTYRDVETGELRRPTLGAAINSIKQENRTPLIAIPDSEVGSDGTFKGQRVYQDQRYPVNAPGYSNYRVGNKSAYQDKMYNLVNDLLEMETKMQLVTNQGIRDEKMATLQRALLRNAIQETSVNPTTDIINLLAEGRNIDRQAGSQDKGLATLATDRALKEKQFYLGSNINEGADNPISIAEGMNRYRNWAQVAIAQGASNRPKPQGEIKTSTYAYDNAPESPNPVDSAPSAPTDPVNNEYISALKRASMGDPNAIEFVKAFRLAKRL